MLLDAPNGIGNGETRPTFALLPRVSTARSIASNLTACFTPLPKPPVSWAFAPMFRSAYLKRPDPARPLLASALLHIGVIACLVNLPSLPSPASPKRENAKREYSVIWYNREDLLPLISPPKPATPSRTRKSRKSIATAVRNETAAARQTIVSRPPNPDNGRQTIVQPEAPELKIAAHVEVPNVVQWMGAVMPPRPETSEAARQLSQIPLPALPAPAVARPPMPLPPPPQLKVETRADAPAIVQPNGVLVPQRPETTEATRQLARVDVPHLPVPAVIPPPPAAPLLPEPNRSIAAVTAPKVILPGAVRPPVPEPPLLNPAPNTAGGPLHNLIAVGVTPAPPPPEQFSVPQGNRAGEFAVISGDGKGDRKASDGEEKGPNIANGLPELADRDLGGIRVPHLSVTGPDSSPKTAERPGAIVANPAPPRAGPATAPRGDDDALAKLIAKAARPALLPGRSRDLDPEVQVFGVRRVYTVAINMPNLTSGSGSWVLRFAELNNGPAAASNGEEISSPVAVRKVDPQYVPSAARERIEGTVTLGAYIMRDGTVKNIRVLSGLDPRLDSSAAAALADWQFQPARKNGAPVDLEIVVQIPFRLPSF